MTWLHGSPREAMRECALLVCTDEKPHATWAELKALIWRFYSALLELSFTACDRTRCRSVLLVNSTCAKW